MNKTCPGRRRPLSVLEDRAPDMHQTSPRPCGIGTRPEHVMDHRTNPLQKRSVSVRALHPAPDNALARTSPFLPHGRPCTDRRARSNSRPGTRKAVWPAPALRQLHAGARRPQDWRLKATSSGSDRRVVQVCWRSLRSRAGQDDPCGGGQGNWQAPRDVVPALIRFDPNWFASMAGMASGRSRSFCVQLLAGSSMTSGSNASGGASA